MYTINLTSYTYAVASSKSFSPLAFRLLTQQRCRLEEKGGRRGGEGPRDAHLLK